VWKKSAITFLLFAWICANGALLDVVQVFAWGKMFSGYAKTMSVAASLNETFDPAKPCEMCIGVATAKEDLGQKKIPANLEQNSAQLVLAFHAASPFVLVNVPEAWPAERGCAAPTRSEIVPVPPPRV
jgi:hypothetical protein